ncbi:MAG: GHKL domain-containing protein [Oscillospiraceae bacterium]|nr:GHKL domain-containing protein [Oscillospiraceae bacterium]
MMVAAISVLSELTMSLVVLYGISMLDSVPKNISRANLIISLAFVVLISACFNLMFGFQSIVLQSVFLIVYYLKFVTAAVILYKALNIKMICITFILHSICNICKTSISFVIPMEQNTATYSSELSLLAVRIIFWFLMVAFNKRKEKSYLNNILEILPNYTYILVLINLFLADGLIEASNYIFFDTSLKDTTVKVLAVSLSLCVFATLVSLLFSVVSRKYFSDINSILEKQIQTQISYYEEREKTYTEIRRFKHDYTNHINCIRSMLKAKRYDEVSEYLGNITDLLPANRFLFNTGNFISDAILSDKQNRIREDNIIIQFDGTIPTSINETDLCIILSNAIDNAVEASREINGKKTISVYGGFSHSYFILTVTNPTNNTTINNNALPFTTKSNKSEHGFGLMNIKSVVDKYNGYMKVENKDNVFTLSLTFNSINVTS